MDRSWLRANRVSDECEQGVMESLQFAEENLPPESNRVSGRAGFLLCLRACCCFSAFVFTCWPVELQWLVFGGVLLCYFIGYCCCCYCFLNGYVLVVVAPV
jgi:hypothetical protein